MKFVWEKPNFDDEFLSKIPLSDVLDEDEEDDDENVQKRPKNLFIPRQVISTIFGPLLANYKHNVTDYFNLWVMDVDFYLTPEVLDKIDKVPGVEVLQPISPYKAIVGFGKLFNASDVRMNIESLFSAKHSDYMTINTLILDEKLKMESLSTLKKCKRHKYWAMYIFPNGEIDHFTTSDQGDFELKLNEYLKCSEESKGLLLYANTQPTH